MALVKALHLRQPPRFGNVGELGKIRRPVPSPYLYACDRGAIAVISNQLSPPLVRYSEAAAHPSLCCQDVVIQPV